MRAVIVDIEDNYAAALCADGSVRKVKNENFQIGQTIVIEEQEQKQKRQAGFLRSWQLRAAAIAAAAVLSVGTVGVSAYAMPYSTVELEAEQDSRISYTVNRLGYVIDVSASDEKSETLLSRIESGKLLHRRIDQAVSSTLDTMTAEAQTSEAIPRQKPRIQVSSDKGDAEHTRRLQDSLDEIVSQKESAPPAEESPAQKDAPSASGNEPTASVEDPSAQDGAPAAPTEDPSAQDGAPAAPAEDLSAQDGRTAAPAEDLSAQDSRTAAPAGDRTAPEADMPVHERAETMEHDSGAGSAGATESAGAAPGPVAEPPTPQ